MPPEKIEADRFFLLSEFQGTVISINDMGLPPPDKVHPNTGPILDLLIESSDGKRYLVEGFHSGVHAKEDISQLVGKEFTYPDKIWTMRGTALTD